MVFSPRRAMMRKSYRFGYEILDRHRMDKKRSLLGGTGDWHLTAARLDQLREICRDLGRNNPLVKGIFRKLATKIIGTSTKIQVRTEDSGWNKEAEALWKEEMVDRPCDVTGRFNIHAYLKTLYYSYCRDGDVFTIFTNEGIQAVEGDQVGTPFGRKKAKQYNVVNGVATDKRTGKVIGYFIGKPNKWGYIANESVQKYLAGSICHTMSSDRFSSSRGEPALISAVDTIDKLFGYVDAELVAAKINACFPIMVKTIEGTGMGPPYTGGVHTSGKDDEDRAVAQIEPGLILDLNPGETANAIGATRPATAFDPFMMRIMSLIGQPVNLPLMLISGDYSGATFMNSRVAYADARDTWTDEQELVIKPFLRRLWIIKRDEWIAGKKLKPHKEQDKFEIICKRWPYVDPFKESKADDQQLKNGATSRTAICARQGTDFKDVTDQRAKDDEYIAEKNVTLDPQKKEPAAKV
jgi:lambda family phage portal protein